MRNLGVIFYLLVHYLAIVSSFRSLTWAKVDNKHVSSSFNSRKFNLKNDCGPLTQNVKDSETRYISDHTYPNDNYEHILGYNDPNHKPSILQQITALRISEVELSKTPIDTVCITLNMRKMI
jgi:hypothetical protein